MIIAGQDDSRFEIALLGYAPSSVFGQLLIDLAELRGIDRSPPPGEAIDGLRAVIKGAGGSEAWELPECLLFTRQLQQLADWLEVGLAFGPDVDTDCLQPFVGLRLFRDGELRFQAWITQAIDADIIRPPLPMAMQPTRQDVIADFPVTTEALAQAASVLREELRAFPPRE